MAGAAIDAGREQVLKEWCVRLRADSDRPARVVLAEGDDPRVRAAANALVRLGVRPVVVVPGPGDVSCTSDDVSLSGDVEVVGVDELRDGRAGEAVRAAGARRGWTSELVAARTSDPVYLAAGAVSSGGADAAVAGACHATSDVLRAGLAVIGLAPGTHLLSSMFLMLLPDGRRLAFADCGVVPEPDADQLAQIAVSTAATYHQLTRDEPAVAMLSFSTMGSADHAGVGKVRHATTLARDLDPMLQVDGELQFDAAYVASVAQRKAPASCVAGRANVFVFPDLSSGNIAYKIAERLAGAAAYGPILQGLARPLNDLSRGCAAADVVNVAVISALQSQSVNQSATTAGKMMKVR